MSAFTTTFAPVAAVCLGIIGILWYIQRTRSSKREKVAKILKIYLYPVKSCAGIFLDKAEITECGLAANGVQDRSWLITDEDGNFRTGRQHPKLVLVKPSIYGDELQFDAPNMPLIRIPIKMSVDRSNVKSCRVWKMMGEGVDCGDEIANWFSTYLGMSVRLVHNTPGMNKFPMHENPMLERGKLLSSKQEVNFVDYSACTILSQASVDLLNSKLEEKIDERNFRPNILVDAISPHAEDNWKKIYIGNIQLGSVKLGERCVFTTVSPVKGEKNKDRQPLKTLESYRFVPEYGYTRDPCFSVDCIINKLGTMQVGQTVYANIGEVPRLKTN